MQRWQSRLQGWLDTCTNTAQALRQSGSPIIQALSAQRLPVLVVSSGWQTVAAVPSAR